MANSNSYTNGCGCCDEGDDCTSDKSEVSTRTASSPSLYQYVYWGSSANSSLNASQITGLQNDQQKLSFADTYLCDANNYKYICYPSSFGSATSFINTLNGLNVPMDTVSVVSVNSVNYNVYRSYFPIVGAVSILIS